MKCALVNLTLLQFVIIFFLLVTVYHLSSLYGFRTYSVKKSNPKIQAWFIVPTATIPHLILIMLTFHSRICLIRRSSICISKIAPAVSLWTAPSAPRLSWMEGRLTHFGITQISSKKLWLHLYYYRLQTIQKYVPAP